MSGTLFIHSRGNGLIPDGHSWIEYRMDGAATSTTYGTWGTNPTNPKWKGGLFIDIERRLPSMIPDASRKMPLDDKAEKKLFQTIQEYANKGPNAWQYGNPCSGFAYDAWKAATGEELNTKTAGISNPSQLKYSINKANGKAVGPISGAQISAVTSVASSAPISAASSVTGSVLGSVASLNRDAAEKLAAGSQEASLNLSATLPRGSHASSLKASDVAAKLAAGAKAGSLRASEAAAKIAAYAKASSQKALTALKPKSKGRGI